MSDAGGSISGREGTRNPAPGREARVLFVSSMTVSPATGGGNTTYNVVEPSPEGGEVFYASPTVYPPNMAPFPELAPRILPFSHIGSAPLPGARRNRTIRRFNNLISRANVKGLINRAARQIMGHIKQQRINVLLISPQDKIDLAASVEVVEVTGIPAVVWFMDDYYTDSASIANVSSLWKKGRHRFVISEAMQQHFSELYGGESEVLNNSVRFPESYPEPPAGRSDPRLLMVYAGAMNSYYVDSMQTMLESLQDLDDRTVLDIYSTDELPADLGSKVDAPWRRFPPTRPDELIGRLREYDVLLLLSSFKPEHRAIAETSQAGKLADYLAAGRCILAYGPDYAENVRYIKRHGLGEVVTYQDPGALRETVLSLVENPGWLREYGERAYRFGREHRDKEKNSARLWRALFDASDFHEDPDE